MLTDSVDVQIRVCSTNDGNTPRVPDLADALIIDHAEPCSSCAWLAKFRLQQARVRVCVLHTPEHANAAAKCNDHEAQQNAPCVFTSWWGRDCVRVCAAPCESAFVACASGSTSTFWTPTDIRTHRCSADARQCHCVSHLWKPCSN